MLLSMNCTDMLTSCFSFWGNRVQKYLMQILPIVAKLFTLRIPKPALSFMPCRCADGYQIPQPLAGGGLYKRRNRRWAFRAVSGIVWKRLKVSFKYLPKIRAAHLAIIKWKKWRPVGSGVSWCQMLSWFQFRCCDGYFPYWTIQIFTWTMILHPDRCCP